MYCTLPKHVPSFRTSRYKTLITRGHVLVGVCGNISICFCARSELCLCVRARVLSDL